jgi:hypothetical protein
VKLIASVFASDGARLLKAEGLLVAKFGSIDYRSEVMPFTHTDYYTREFGAPLVRKIVSFDLPIDRGLLSGVKHQTNELEFSHSVGGRRWVNIDPGYVSLSKLVLATTKDRAHRIYLRDGIYAEVTLYYHRGTFCAWPWSYPDYASPPYIAIFNHIRDQYHQQLRALGAGL